MAASSLDFLDLAMSRVKPFYTYLSTEGLRWLSIQPSTSWMSWSSLLSSLPLAFLLNHRLVLQVLGGIFPGTWNCHWCRLSLSLPLFSLPLFSSWVISFILLEAAPSHLLLIQCLDPLPPHISCTLFWICLFSQWFHHPIGPLLKLSACWCNSLNAHC